MYASSWKSDFTFLSGRPLGFYIPLISAGRNVNAKAFGAAAADYETPEPLNKLPNFRPSLSWYGYKEGMRNQKKKSEIAAKAELSKAPKENKRGCTAKPISYLASLWQNVAQKLLVLPSDDDEGFGFWGRGLAAPAPSIPSRSSLDRKIPEPK